MLFKENFAESRCFGIRCQGGLVDDEKGKLGLETGFWYFGESSSTKGQ
jgi:hypothetical protein